MKSLTAQANEILKDTPNGERFSWNYKQRKFAAHVIKDRGLDNFLQWSESRESIYSGWTKEAKEERLAIPETLRQLSQDPGTGNPPGPMSPEGASGTYIRQTYVAYQIMNNIAPIEDIRSIIEFGGGYGALPVVLNRLGFPGEHLVYDLPIMHLIREWYLGKQGITDTVSVINTDYLPKSSSDLVISIHGINEAPEDIRVNFLKNVFGKHYFFFIHKIWNKENMIDWFGDWFLSEGIAPKTITPPNRHQYILYGSRK